MDESSSVQPLTKANLQRLRGIKPTPEPAPSGSPRWSDRVPYLPSDRLKRAKIRLSHVLWKLLSLGSDGARILDAQDVYRDNRSELRYRGTAVPEPDLEDPNFWETRWQDLDDRYSSAIDFARAKNAVYRTMGELSGSSEGRALLANYELYIVSKGDIRYRGNYPMPNLEDITYWKNQERYLMDKYRATEDRLPGPKSYLSHRRETNSEDSNRCAMLKRALKYESGWVKPKKGVKKWVNRTQETGTSLPEPCSPTLLHNPSERASVGGIEDSLGEPVRMTPYGRWRLANWGVYNRMTALWKLGGEGREIVKNDELRIVGPHDVRYRRSRGPKPDLKDPSYWEAKWEYFTDKLVSLLRARQDDSSLLPWLGLGDEDLMELPVPGSASGVLSTAPSPVESFRPNLASRRAFTIKRVKETMYETLTNDFYRNEGRHILENDEVYIAGENDIRYQHKTGLEPDIQNPRYWVDKNAYFNNIYMNFTLSQQYASDPSAMHDWHPLSQPQTQAQASTTGSVVHVSTPVQGPVGQSDSTPVSGMTRAEATGSPGRSKRKRGGQLNDTSQTEEHLSHPAKRIKSGAEQAGQAARGPSIHQLHTSNSASDTALLDAIEENATRTPPRRRRTQRIIYENKRTSRRLAGLLPEFGLLPERGEELLPYEAPSRPSSNTRKTNNSDSRSSGISRKLTTAKGAKHGGVSKSVRENADRPKRPKRR